MKPTLRLDIYGSNTERPLEDYKVDRSGVEVQQCTELTDTNGRELNHKTKNLGYSLMIRTKTENKERS